MRFIHTLCLSLALTVSSTSLTAQAQNGSGYFLHTVTKGQSLYSIASMYHVTVDDIVRLNPGSRDQIRAGEALKIPQVQTSNQSSSTFHTIQAGETLYQLTVKYNITAQAICDASASDRLSLYPHRELHRLSLQPMSNVKNLNNRPKRKRVGKTCTRWSAKKPFSASVRCMVSARKN